MLILSRVGLSPLLTSIRILRPSGFRCLHNRSSIGASDIIASSASHERALSGLVPPNLSLPELPTQHVTSSCAARFRNKTINDRSSPFPPKRSKTGVSLGRPWRSRLVPPLDTSESAWEELSARLIPFFEGLKSSSEAAVISEEDLMEAVDHITLRLKLLYDLSQTPDAQVGWNAYTSLMALATQGDVASLYTPFIPHSHLHRLCTLLARTRPATRTQFHQLLTVVNTIRSSGGQINQYEWNALIHRAGSGIRKTRVEHLERSLSVFNDMVAGNEPGREFNEDSGLVNWSHSTKIDPPLVEPNIVTYTSLISIAARTLDGPSLNRAITLLKQSGLPPNRITHLSMIRYFTFKKLLQGVRATLLRMQDQGFELGIDGLNACIWAYSQNERTDIAMTIYRLIRHNVAPGYVDDEEARLTAHRLEKEEAILITDDLLPNEITYSILIQTMAYHGDFPAVLGIFTDFLSSTNLEEGASIVPEENGDLKPVAYSPTFGIYRAIFLGFSRHAIPSHKATSGKHNSTWTLQNLQTFFDTFIEWPEKLDPPKSLIYWIMIAFDKASGRDSDLLRKIWLQLERRFNGPWGGASHRLQRMRKDLFMLK